MDVDVTFIVIHFGDAEPTRLAVTSLFAAHGHGCAYTTEVLVVDNASHTPFTMDERIASPRVLRLESNRGYGAACNAGAREARGRFLFILNNDIEARGDIVAPLLSRLEADVRIGAIGPRLEFPDGRFQLSWGDAPSLWSEFRERGRQRRNRRGEAVRDRERATAQPVDWITGAAMLLPRGAWEAIEGFDERYFFYFEDVDLCTRLWQAGFAVHYEPAACLTHVGGGSDPGSNPRIVRGYRIEQLRYYARWRSMAQFLLLKLYLFVKFAGTALRGGDSARALLGDIFRATRRDLLHRS